MNSELGGRIMRGFWDSATVDCNLLEDTRCYVERALGRPATGAPDYLLEQLEKEEFNQDTTQAIKELLVKFAAQTDRVDHFASTVAILKLFNDPKLHILLTAWLDIHLRKLLNHNSAVSQLLFALEDSGADVPFRASAGTIDVESNIEAARQYLHAILGIRYPW